jgi:hypothetical protein
MTSLISHVTPDVGVDADFERVESGKEAPRVFD